jgi:DNA repair photolyase
VRRFQVFEAEAKSILSPTSGFIAAAGFTHSLTPARNCTFACTYCYVPTMRVHGGLKRDDWERWGQFTTAKTNAPELLSRELRSDQIVYCSPLVDPYQPAEAELQLMPRILDTLSAIPPKIFVIQTRGPLILRDLEKLKDLSARCRLRVSFSLTTDREDVRRLFEPHCVTFEERLQVIAQLNAGGIETYSTLAPLLPCNLETLAERAMEAAGRDLIGDPLHVRRVKAHGATTRDAAYKIAELHGFMSWFEPEFQNEATARIRAIAERAGRRFATGVEGFSWLARF